MFIALTMTIAKVTYSHHGQHRVNELLQYMYSQPTPATARV